MTFRNVYQDTRRAESYAKLEFPGTYYLAYRDLPEILARHARGRRALDFGCGTGRSTRFLKQLGYEAVGVDISEEMLALARARDASGDYRLVGKAGLSGLAAGSYDLVLSVFTFDNIPTEDRKTLLFRELAGLLAQGGFLVSVVSSPEIYRHEWCSFSTKEFPENLSARSGDRVRIVMTDVEDRRPVEDVVCTDESYRGIYERAGLRVTAMYAPLGRADEPYPWVNETAIAPWIIYVLEVRSEP